MLFHMEKEDNPHSHFLIVIMSFHLHCHLVRMMMTMVFWMSRPSILPHVHCGSFSTSPFYPYVDGDGDDDNTLFSVPRCLRPKKLAFLNQVEWSVHEGSLNKMIMDDHWWWWWWFSFEENKSRHHNHPGHFGTSGWLFRSFLVLSVPGQPHVQAPAFEPSNCDNAFPNNGWPSGWEFQKLIHCTSFYFSFSSVCTQSGHFCADACLQCETADVKLKFALPNMEMWLRKSNTASVIQSPQGELSSERTRVTLQLAYFMFSEFRGLLMCSTIWPTVEELSLAWICLSEFSLPYDIISVSGFVCYILDIFGQMSNDFGTKCMEIMILWPFLDLIGQNGPIFG